MIRRHRSDQVPVCNCAATSCSSVPAMFDAVRLHLFSTLILTGRKYDRLPENHIEMCGRLSLDSLQEQSVTADNNDPHFLPASQWSSRMLPLLALTGCCILYAGPWPMWFRVHGICGWYLRQLLPWSSSTSSSSVAHRRFFSTISSAALIRQQSSLVPRYSGTRFT